MKHLKHIIPLIIIFFLSCGVCAVGAENLQPLQLSENLSLRLSQRTWLSTGESFRNFAASDGSPDVLSELIYDDVDSTVVELTADALFLKKYILTIDFGYGSISGGTLKDSDYAGDNRTLLWSQSVGTVDDDDMYYINIDLGYRVFGWSTSVPTQEHGNERFTLDILTGYQHWLETYTATEFIQTQDPYNLFGGTGPFDDQGRGITEEYTWDSFRIGARAEIELLPGLSIKTRLMFVPWTHYEDRDIHHMRTDLKQNPSIEARADGGFGIMSDTTLSCNVWRGLSIEAGFQIWDIESGSGTKTSRAFTGDIDMRHNEANTTRQGMIVGISYTF